MHFPFAIFPESYLDLYCRGIGLAVTRLLLHNFNANVVALARSRTDALDALESNSLLFIGCDVSVIDASFPYQACDPSPTVQTTQH